MTARLQAIVLLAFLLLHGWEKPAGERIEMLWGCHVASALLALGLLTGRKTPVYVGFLFHVAIGLPSYVIEILTHGTTWTSVVVHVLPLWFGALFARAHGWPDGLVAKVCLFFAALLPVSMLAPPALNVNQARHLLPPFDAFAPWWWASWIVHLGLSYGFARVADRLLRARFASGPVSLPVSV